MFLSETTKLTLKTRAFMYGLRLPEIRHVSSMSYPPSSLHAEWIPWMALVDPVKGCGLTQIQTEGRERLV